MFLLIGFRDKKEIFNKNKTIICPNCSEYGMATPYRTYKTFNLFFIPLVEWSEKFYINMSCCDSIYEIPWDEGKKIESNEFKFEDLYKFNNINRNLSQICSKCNNRFNRNYKYCPMCGEKK